MPRLRDSLGTSIVEGQRRGVRTGIAIAWATIILAILPQTRGWRVFEAIQNWAYDSAIERRLVSRPEDVAVIAIDDRSLQHIGQFPWPRTVYARLLDKLGQARAVGFDIIFHEPDRTSEAKVGTSGDVTEADAEFARAIKAHGRCVLASHIAGDVEVRTGAVRPPPALPLTNPPPRLRRVRQVQLQTPLPVLAQAAAGVGFVDIQADRDKIYRRVALLVADELGQVYPHFALEVARVAYGLSREDVAQLISADAIRLRGRVPLSSAAEALVDYPGPAGTVRWYSFWAVLNGQIEPSAFADKAVLVGATAPGLKDIRPGPFRRARRPYAGVEINAAICHMLLRGHGIADASGSTLWILLGGLLATAGVAAVWKHSDPKVGFLVGLGLIAVEAGGFLAAFYGASTVLPIGPALAATTAALAYSAYGRLGLERRVVRSQFSVYVSPHVLAELMRNPAVLYQGERRDVTVVFADIRGSTSLAERLPPEEWLAQLNEYLTAMSDVILGHEGYLDKFMGDGIMAVWNAFGNQPHHRDLALMACIAMLDRLEHLNERWARHGTRPPLRVAIGVHSGEAIVGNVGSTQRTQFTVIGDTVNAAARIEAAGKQFEVPLAISHQTVQGLRRKYALEELGEVTLRGREQPVKLYTIRAAREVGVNAGQAQEA